MRTLEERFWARVKKTKNCWVWIGGTANNYGTLLVNGKHTQAHRFAYELLVGTIPKGLEIDHLCSNKLCVKPAHLEPVTHRINILRGAGWAASNARKTHCSKGHIYNLFNTHVNKNNERICRQCWQRPNRKVNALFESV